MELADKALSGTKILCVDDCVDVLNFLRIVLEKNGAEVTTCLSAEDAITILKKEHFNLLISDLSMSDGLDGFDLAHALRGLESEDPNREVIPSILLSTDALKPSRKRRFADFQVYMPKPFDKARLVQVIERLVEADADAVKLGSLPGWEAEQATEAAAIATAVAATATEAAAEATATAADATSAAIGATQSALRATKVAAKAEIDAANAAAKAPARDI